MIERWPPIYDARDLASQIHELVISGRLEKEFYDLQGEPVLCQGDIFRLVAPLPVIDELGEATALDDVEYWMAIGNTCDFSRSIEDVCWTQLIPIFDLTELSAVSAQDLHKLRTYQPFRKFYVPPWRSDLLGRLLVVDFTRPIAVHKKAIFDVATLERRLSHYAWILFHSCLIRFLARDDGRLDAPR